MGRAEYPSDMAFSERAQGTDALRQTRWKPQGPATLPVVAPTIYQAPSGRLRRQAHLERNGAAGPALQRAKFLVPGAAAGTHHAEPLLTRYFHDPVHCEGIVKC